jgi:hypothetical protein
MSDRVTVRRDWLRLAGALFLCRPFAGPGKNEIREGFGKQTPALQYLKARIKCLQIKLNCVDKNDFKAVYMLRSLMFINKTAYKNLSERQLEDKQALGRGLGKER